MFTGYISLMENKLEISGEFFAEWNNIFYMHVIDMQRDEVTEGKISRISMLKMNIYIKIFLWGFWFEKFNAKSQSHQKWTLFDIRAKRFSLLGWSWQVWILQTVFIHSNNSIEFCSTNSPNDWFHLPRNSREPDRWNTINLLQKRKRDHWQPAIPV